MVNEEKKGIVVANCTVQDWNSEEIDQNGVIRSEEEVTSPLTKKAS